MAISSAYVRDRTEKSDAKVENLICFPANNFSSFVDWRVAAPGHAHFRGLFFVTDT
jgi:predicted secreted protein